MTKQKSKRSPATRPLQARGPEIRLGAAGLPSAPPDEEGRFTKMRRRVRLRMLPLVLLAIFFLFSAKIGTVWQSFSTNGVSVANQAQAQSAVPGSPLALADAKAAPPAAEMPRDPTRFSQSEIDLLQALAARRDQLDRREKDLDQRETLLQAAEKRVNDKAAELEGVRGDLLKLIEKRTQEDDSKLKSLVRIYESMKPKEAATILQEWDADKLVELISRMKEAKVGPILASMSPDKAKTVTTLLAGIQDGPSTAR
jgi:flagellar motility protein MotE (MotC chaperone)